ncbi:MAG: hypothetical protein H6695_15225 [Deferribacteres bacterium]|nr:hypothetical protein [candidate division KSB1 bacterium]MCB9511539.1 hypothetical protein [Deferribacteres bacterium]
MVKRTLTIIATLALLASTLHAGEKITWRDGSKVFTWANAVEKSHVVDGRHIGEAWHLSYARDGEDELLGLVVLSSVSVDGQAINLVVGISTSGEISRVAVREHGVVDAEFLAQFEGLSAASDFAIAESVDDLTTIPAALKAMRGKEALSMAIASEVSAVLATTTGVAGTVPTP